MKDYLQTQALKEEQDPGAEQGISVKFHGGKQASAKVTENPLEAGSHDNYLPLILHRQ